MADHEDNQDIITSDSTTSNGESTSSNSNKQPQSNSNKDENTPAPVHPSLVSRILDYPIVHYATDTAGEIYNKAKSYNEYSKKVFETAESYATPIVNASLTKLDEISHQPIVEGIIARADSYGNQQLDKFEDGIQKIKDVTPKVIKTAENAIHGTKVESILIKTVGVIDNVVEALLPPPKSDENKGEVEEKGGEEEGEEGEEEEGSEGDEVEGETHENETEKTEVDVTIVTATTPVIKKIRTRVSKKAVLRLPIQAYSGLKELATRQAETLTLPQVLGHYSKYLSTASGYISTLATKSKGAELSKASVDFIYQSLDRISASVNSLVAITKKIDPSEARVTLTELSNMITASKQNVIGVLDNSAQKLKEDSSAILLRAGDALARPLEAGYTRIAHSDVAAIRNAFSSLESAVQGIMERYKISFSIQAEQKSD